MDRGSVSKSLPTVTTCEVCKVIAFMMDSLVKNNVSEVTHHRAKCTGKEVVVLGRRWFTGEAMVVQGTRWLYWGGGSYIMCHLIQVDAKALMIAECGKLGVYTQMVGRDHRRSVWSAISCFQCVILVNEYFEDIWNLLINDLVSPLA